MKLFTIAMLVLLGLSAGSASAQNGQRLYRWVDGEGIVHYGDSIPAEYSEIERQVVNEHGITVDVMQAKKTEEELAEERRLQDLARDRELQRRADQALLATYVTVDEILMHRDRRVELFQAQSRVTELYLRNLQRRMDTLRTEASGFRPYSDDPDAPMIDPDLANDLSTTKATIARHEQNLERFHEDEQSIVARFDGDVDRFKALKGLN
ncbi:MAG: DUF4124 domain-containing protein [Proteobacteria bacterium]|nr:DUF4124 domain-containing protein [Pseudomonadota bacterium]MDA0995220.1 DUF4124 domain-containing protein [Pseudomonadota bacterium]